ncbi:MAG: hypothetical protein FWD43_02550, partial [Coriobacteriia bacterium]|nr:hypothetical protein [Coriobacteriia bacterium]
EEATNATKAPLSAVAAFNRRVGNPQWIPHPELGVDGMLEDSQWELFITSERIVLWSRLSTDMFGKPKEKSGRATGGAIDYDDIDQISRNGERGLIFVTEKGGAFIDMMALELQFPNLQAAAWFSSNLAKRIPAFWASEVEEAKMLLDLDYFDSHSTDNFHQMMYKIIREKAAIDVSRIEAEINKLRDFNWANPYATLSISLSKAGARVY